MSVVQGAEKGRGADQVLPRLLYEVSEDPIRHPTSQMSKVQRGLRRQRFPPPILCLGLVLFKEFPKTSFAQFFVFGRKGKVEREDLLRR